MMQAVIMAGGKGTRLATLTKDEIPKPMVPVAGKPLLLWQVERLKENGITDIIMVIGHLGDKIREYFGDGEKFGVAIRYFEETEPLGTAGSFYYLKDMIHGDRFVMMSGDLFFDIDFHVKHPFLSIFYKNTFSFKIPMNGIKKQHFSAVRYLSSFFVFCLTQ